MMPPIKICQVECNEDMFTLQIGVNCKDDMCDRLISRCLTANVLSGSMERYIIQDILYFILLHCTVLYYTALHCSVLHCSVLYCTPWRVYNTGYILFYLIALYCTVLHQTLVYCTALQCTVVFSMERHIILDILYWMVVY